MNKTDQTKDFVDQIETIDPNDVERIARAVGASVVRKVDRLPNHLGGGVKLRPDHVEEDLELLLMKRCES